MSSYKEEGLGAYISTVEFLFNRFPSAAFLLLFGWWNDFGERHLIENQRVYRAVISFKLTEIYLTVGLSVLVAISFVPER